jgi:hypothetical protein
MYISFRGDYRNCDIPIWTAQAILQYAAESENDVSHKEIPFMLFSINNSKSDRLIFSITLVIYHLIMYGINLVLINSILSPLSINY